MTTPPQERDKGSRPQAVRARKRRVYGIASVCAALGGLLLGAAYGFLGNLESGEWPPASAFAGFLACALAGLLSLGLNSVLRKKGNSHR